MKESIANPGAIKALNDQIRAVTFGTNSKLLNVNLEDNWTTAVPNDAIPHPCTIDTQGGIVVGFIMRYSNNYGAGFVTRYDGRGWLLGLNNGAVSTIQVERLL